MHTILILGAGPAGAAVALGLRRLGYPVTLVSDWRRFPALEGASQRVLEALRGAGLEQALAQALQPSGGWHGTVQNMRRTSNTCWIARPSTAACGRPCAKRRSS